MKNDKTALVSVRVSAAKSVLELGLKAREVLEVEARLQVVENRLKALPDKRER